MAKKKMSPNSLLALGLGGCGALIVIALVVTRFLKSEPPAPPPPPPPPPEKTVTGLLKYNDGYWRATVDEDAKHLRLKADPADLEQPFRYTVELDKPQLLKAERGTIETRHVRVATHVIKEWATTDSGEGFRYEHMVLDITNRAQLPIAYRIETRPDHPTRCKSKGQILHNAIALRPDETVRRTECLWHKGAMLAITRIEVMELPELGYYYVSRLPPTQIGLDERTSSGHEVPKGTKTCMFVPWREIQSATGATWADVIDFYARHNCDEYSFFRSYRRLTAPAAMPARPPISATPAAPSPDGGVTRAP